MLSQVWTDANAFTSYFHCHIAVNVSNSVCMELPLCLLWCYIPLSKTIAATQPMIVTVELFFEAIL
jgi:hypothetical protein